MSSSYDFGRLADPIHHQTEEQVRWAAQIAESARGMRDGERVTLGDQVPFPWDRVCIFGGGASETFVNETLGFTWLAQRDFVEEDRQIWVFVHDGQVGQHLVLSPPLIGSRATQDARMGLCLQPQEAVFTVESFSTTAYRRVFWMLD
ncbi:MAG: hypothetical protein IPK19_36615 [Chloroflexi bacterium]|nr:hypothetical protein [Chloroflexota bacterium]